MKILILLLLTGCATVSLDDLYAQRAACLSQRLDCSDLDEAIQHKEDMRQWRKNTEMPCPDNYVAVCDSIKHRGCGRRVSKTQVEYVCVHERAIWGAFGF